MNVPPREGATIILEKPNGRIAMQLRDDNLKWGLFGGWSEPHETPEQTILREIQEELGVALKPNRLTFLKSFAFKGLGIAHVFHYPVQIELDNAVLTEGIAFQFLKLSEIAHKSVPENHREILTYYSTNPVKRREA